MSGESNWIEWKYSKDKPYPETPATRVHVKMKGDSSEFYGNALPVSDWAWIPSGEITHYMKESDK